MLKEYDNINEETKQLNSLLKILVIYKTMLLYCLKCRKKNTERLKKCKDKKRKNNAFIKM